VNRGLGGPLVLLPPDLRLNGFANRGQGIRQLLEAHGSRAPRSRGQKRRSPQRIGALMTHKHRARKIAGARKPDRCRSLAESKTEKNQKKKTVEPGIRTGTLSQEQQGRYAAALSCGRCSRHGPGFSRSRLRAGVQKCPERCQPLPAPFPQSKTTCDPKEE
jgi:hypothetical protein